MKRQEIIKNDLIWLEMIEQRNLSSHIYDEEEIKEILDRINDYDITFKELITNFRNIISSKDF